MNNLSKLLLEASNLLNESIKSAKKYKLENYLKQYGYDKKNKKITVDGKTVYVREKTKDDIDDGYGTSIEEYSDGSHTLALGKEFKKLKNNKRRDNTVRHEIAHAKLQSLKDPNVTLDNKSQRIYEIKDPNKREKIINIVTTSGYKKPEEYNEKDKARVKNMKIFREYDKGNHSIPSEYEADAYAKYNKNGDQLSRTIRETYKHQRKHIEKNGNPKKYWEQAVSDDIKNRKKAVNDKRLSIKAYQENVYELLSEAIDLLNL